MSAWDLVSTLAHQMHEPLDVQEPSGFTVHFESGFYWVRFAYERTVVQLVKAVPGAQYLPEERLWCVPLAQYTPLRNAIAAARAHYGALADSAQEVQTWCATHHPHSTVRKAYTKDGAAHEGPCLMVQAHYCVLGEGSRTLRVHERAALLEAHTQQPFTPKEQVHYRIEYRDGLGYCSPIQESAHA
jgi:hypothetical protein